MLVLIRQLLTKECNQNSRCITKTKINIINNYLGQFESSVTMILFLYVLIKNILLQFSTLLNQSSSSIYIGPISIETIVLLKLASSIISFCLYASFLPVYPLFFFSLSALPSTIIDVLSVYEAYQISCNSFTECHFFTIYIYIYCNNGRC